jgi:transketolase
VDAASRRLLADRALRVRERILRMATRGGCFLGASLSCADLLVYLYSRFLRFAGPEDPDRDFLLLSKGHDVPALYATLAELGHLDPRRLEHHLSADDSIYWHPSRAVPGVEFHSGSLGHLLAVGLGVALAAQLARERRRVVVLLGDGECDEGSVWEALLVASARRMDNLLIIVDRNGFQANMRTEDLVPLESLEEKFRAFGAAACTVDGHDFDSLESACARFPFSTGRPSAVIARTVRGKGLSSIENRADRWFCNFSAEEIARLAEELHGSAPATLLSEPRAVR